MTLAEYFERGGRQDALERHAEATFEKLDKEQQELARNVFTHLIEIGRGTEDTRRTANFAELVPASGDPGKIEAVVQALSAARLITTDAPTDETRTVTISHETLIDACPRLKRLVNESRAAIALQNDIGQDAAQWDGHGRDASYLYSGARLQTAREQLEANKITLNALAKAFIDASIHEEEERVRLKEAARQNELEQARLLAAQQPQIAEEQRKRADTEYRQRVRLRWMLGILAVLFIAAIGAAIYAVQQARIATARQMAAQARALAKFEPDTALLLAKQASQTDDSLATRSSLLAAHQCCSHELEAFLRGHTDRVWSVAYSPDGKTLASGGDDGSIVLWDVGARRVITPLIGAQSLASIYSVAFSPVGNLLASGSAGGSIKLWDLTTRQPISPSLRGHEANVHSIAFSPDGSKLVSGGADGRVIVWDVASRKVITEIEGHNGWVWSVAFSPDGQTVASGGRDSMVRLWNWEARPGTTATQVLTDHGATVVSVAFHPNKDKPLLVSGDTNGNVILWDLTRWQIAREKPLHSRRLQVQSGSYIWGLAFSADGQALATGNTKGIVKVWRIDASQGITQSRLAPLTLGMVANAGGVFRIAFSPDGKHIAAGRADSTVTLWRAAESSEVIRHDADVYGAGFSKDNTRLVSVSLRGEITTRDFVANQLRRRDIRAPVTTTFATLSPAADIIATENLSKTIQFWDATEGKLLGAPLTEPVSLTNGLSFNPDGTKLASAGKDGNIIVWDMPTRKQLAVLKGHRGAVATLAFSPDGAILASGGCGTLILNRADSDCARGEVRLWDLTQFAPIGEPLPTKSGFVRSLAFASRDNLLASGSADGTITVFDIVNRRIVREFGGTDAVLSLAFSPDGRLLASGTSASKVILWDMEHGQQFGDAFSDHDEGVTALAFSSDGNLLVSASKDNTVVMHDLRPETWRLRACQIANRNLTLEEWQRYIGNIPYAPYEKTCPELP